VNSFSNDIVPSAKPFWGEVEERRCLWEEFLCGGELDPFAEGPCQEHLRIPAGDRVKKKIQEKQKGRDHGKALVRGNFSPGLACAPPVKRRGRS